MNWNFKTKNCSQRPHGVKENGIAVSFTTAKSRVLVEYISSRGLEADCPPHSLGWAQRSQAPGLPSLWFEGWCGRLWSFKDQEMDLLSGNGLEELGQILPSPASWFCHQNVGAWRPAAGSRTSLLSGIQLHSTVSSLIQETALEGAVLEKDSNLLLWSHGLERPEVSKDKQAWGLQEQTGPGLISGGQGWEVPRSLQHFVEAFSSHDYSLKPDKFPGERCLCPTKSSGNLRYFSWRISVQTPAFSTNFIKNFLTCSS